MSTPPTPQLGHGSLYPFFTLVSTKLNVYRGTCSTTNALPRLEAASRWIISALVLVLDYSAVALAEVLRVSVLALS